MNLMLGDCLERMKEIPDGSVDLTVTSPPYDNLRTYNNAIEWGEHVWKRVFNELFRVTKTGGVVVWIVNDATIKGSETGTSFKQALYAKEIGFNLHDTMIWCKPFIVPRPAKRYEPSSEFMFVFSKGSPASVTLIKDKENKGFGRKITGYKRKADGTPRMIDERGQGKFVAEFGVRHNVWVIDTSRGKKGYAHPASFPVQLANDHIVSWSKKGDKVLDPFMGSGTTGVACKNLNRKFIGIEKDEKYFEIAKARIEAA